MKQDAKKFFPKKSIYMMCVWEREIERERERERERDVAMCKPLVRVWEKL